MVPSQKGEKIGARRLAFCIYPYRTPFYQEGHPGDGVGKFYLCRKLYAPTSHPMCSGGEKSTNLAVAIFSGWRIWPIWPEDFGLEVLAGHRHFSSLVVEPESCQRLLSLAGDFGLLGPETPASQGCRLRYLTSWPAKVESISSSDISPETC
jgi:hypothetical protein